MTVCTCCPQAEKLLRPPDADEDFGSWFSNPAGKAGEAPSQVGKYLQTSSTKSGDAVRPAEKRKLSVFDAW